MIFPHQEEAETLKSFGFLFKKMRIALQDK